MVCQETATTNYDLGSVIGYQEISQGNLNITFTQGSTVRKFNDLRWGFFHRNRDVEDTDEALLHYYHAHLMLPVASLVLSMASTHSKLLLATTPSYISILECMLMHLSHILNSNGTRRMPVLCACHQTSASTTGSASTTPKSSPITSLSTVQVRVQHRRSRSLACLVDGILPPWLLIATGRLKQPMFRPKDRHTLLSRRRLLYGYLVCWLDCNWSFLTGKWIHCPRHLQYVCIVARIPSAFCG